MNKELINDAREFVRSCYGKPQSGDDAAAQDAIVNALLIPFTAQKLKEREAEIADELTRIKFSTLSASGFGRSVADYIDKLRSKKK